MENDSYKETAKTLNKKERKRTLYGATGCTFPSFASSNKKVKSICLLKGGTSVRQASVHLEIAVSRQMKAEWSETLAESTSPAGPLIFKLAGLIDMHLPLLPSPTLSCPLPFLPPSLQQIPPSNSRILTEWQETRTDWAGKDVMSVTANNKRCKGASFPKLLLKCKMGTKTLHFLL